MKIKIHGKEYTVKVGGYALSPMAMYIALYDDEGCQYTTATKNFGNYYDCPRCESFMQPNTAYLDVNNDVENMLPDIIKALGGKPYVKWGQEVVMSSGYCLYPYYEFDKEKLMQCEGYETYMEGWQKQCNIEQEKMAQALFN